MCGKFYLRNFEGKSRNYSCIERKSEKIPQPSQNLEPVLLRTNKIMRLLAVLSSNIFIALINMDYVLKNVFGINSNKKHLK